MSHNTPGLKSDKSSDNKVVEVETIYEDTKCGLGSCTPSWLQYLARKEVYVLVNCLGGLTQGMFFTYSVSVLSSIEKRFKFTSKITGSILAGNDISQALFSILVAYFGNYGHRPRWMAIGGFSAAISCFLAGSSHFLYGPGEEAEFLANTAQDPTLTNVSSTLASAGSEGLCHEPFHQTCEVEDVARADFEVVPAVLLFVSQFMLGICISITYSIGYTYLDDNIDKRETPFYYAISMILRVLGPVLGFFLGSRCLTLWVDPSKEPNLSRSDPRWLGAWWLGYMILGVGLVVFSGLYLFFPRKLPETAQREAKRLARIQEKRAAKSDNKDFLGSLMELTTSTERKKPSLKKLPSALMRLFTNKIWMGNLFNTVVFLLAIAGYWNFKPKYLESQFRKSASEANFYTGAAGLVASVLGLAISGVILRWIRPGPRFVSGYAIFLTFFSSITMFSLIYIGCPKLDIKGPMSNQELLPCSEDCKCSDRFVPVCSQDGKTVFYSPCYAGCSGVNKMANPTEYTSCKCIVNSLPTNRSAVIGDEEAGWGKVVRGYCHEECDGFTIYIIIQIIAKMVGSTGRVGGTLLHLRCVSDEDKALALGTFTVFLSIFSFIPAPIIMGAIVDSACLIWEEKCGRRGNCWFYDSDKFRYILHAVPADEYAS
ncbi:solute carrier organic anion transporter family member 74D-like isoform X2 [Oratosquilla oratoria]|uniref:solute carrier organic anion transporter family member 74D-like isoform X2 n=1 Tax=Oratosquilla oratoria TaxID=337810 RepID=UPI003F76D96E